MRAKVLISALVFSLVFVVLAYSVYTITLTDMRVENFQIYRQNVTDPVTEVTTTEVFLALNFTMYNASGNTEGANKIFDLTAGQKTAIVNFIKPFVQATGTEYEVDIPAWAQP